MHAFDEPDGDGDDGVLTHRKIRRDHGGSSSQFLYLSRFLPLQNPVQGHKKENESPGRMMRRQGRDEILDHDGLNYPRGPLEIIDGGHSCFLYEVGTERVSPHYIRSGS